MVKVKVKDVLTFSKVAANLLAKEKGKFSPFLYALNKVKKQTEGIVDDYNDETEEARLTLAGKDEDGYVLIDEKTNTYRLTPENTVKLNKKVIKW